MFMQQPEADRLVQLATVELAGGHLVQAAHLLNQAMQADPHHPMALTKQAELALYRKDHVRALALTNAALAVEPNFAPAWDQRASACWLAGRQTEAVQAARKALDIQPPNPGFRLRLAQFAVWTGQGAEAMAALAPLLRDVENDAVHYAMAISMVGELAVAEGRFNDACCYLDQALRLQPALSQTRMLRGMNLLRLGRFGEGWIDYMAREAIPSLYPDGQPKLADQLWQGQALTGKTLVVTDDQGHGDAIQFCRYLPLLRDRGTAHITWRTFPPLVRLLGEAASFATILSALPDDPKFDFQCHSTSLPRWFGTELGNVPMQMPYLQPPSHLKFTMNRTDVRPSNAQQAKPILCNEGQTSQRKAARSTRARPIREQLKVGLAWSGDARHPRDHLRSISADLFLGLTDLPGIVFHSLQHQVRTADLPALTARPAIGREVEKAADFADTAALIACLDLVITVDTGIAHLAGALGKPVWIVLHVAADWRWLAERSDSPWYPTARLFRVTPAEWLQGHAAVERGFISRDPSEHPPATVQIEAGWGPVLARVTMALRALTMA